MNRFVFVIAEPCIGVRDGSCVAVCPVDCIHGNGDSPQLYIDPAECIACGLCSYECPVDAIFPQDELPEAWRPYLEINAAFFEKDTGRGAK